MRKVFIISILALTFGGCSQFSYNPVSVAWHNTNAHFNSLVIARENMKAAEKTLFDGRNDVYSQLLPILLPIDSTYVPKNKEAGLSSFLSPFSGNQNSTDPFSSLSNNTNNQFQVNGNSPQSLGSSVNNSVNSMNNNVNSFGNGINNGGNTQNGNNSTGLSNGLLPAKDIKTNLSEVVKKTSLIAERHSNSKYLDEAYFLLGKARLYKGDYLHAIEVFKYINTKGTDENQKHAALIGLMRAYIEQDDLETALKVSENLRLLELNDKNTIDFYLTKAYLHELTGEYATATAISEEALKLMKKGSQKARLEYITGQLYDLTGKPTLAATHYANVEKMHPDYDLVFNARLNKLLDGSPQQGSLENDFNKMLADRKNKELKDQIYFTMGSIDEKNGNYEKAITNYQKSVKASLGGQQKAYTFLKLAELNYDKLQNYTKASAYYDSCLLVLPKSAIEYDRITKRATTLNDFVTYTTTIKTEDSLQKLATMPPMELDKYLEKSIKDKEDAKNVAIELAKKKALQSSNENLLADTETDFKRWELYDPITVGVNKSAFTMIWGSRPLEDNWRRKDKEGGSISFKVEKGIIDPSTPKTSAKIDSVAIDDPAQKLAVAKKILYETIPKTPEKLAESQKKVEEAYYELGKIYRLQFNEPENAKKTFETLLANFPNTQHEAEVLYFLHLMNGGESIYKTTLLSKYPHSTYARQLARGNVAITGDTESQANIAYKNAYELYTQNNFSAGLTAADDGLLKFTGTSIEDKFAMLRILLLAKTEQKEQYTQALKEFVQSYSNSDLLLRAKEMLKIIAP